MLANLWNLPSLFDGFERATFGDSAGWPAFDIEDDDTATTLTADVPGLTDEDLEVAVHPPLLIIRGERKPREGRYLQRARWHGAFERTFRLQDGYDLDEVEARVSNGVLTIRLSKTEKMKPRRVKLGGKSGVVDRVKGLLSGDKHPKVA